MIADLDIPVQFLPGYDRAFGTPCYASAGAAGMDLRACLAVAERAEGLVLPALGRVLVPTGLALAIPAGFEGQIRPRSGLAVHRGITVLNAPGTIDADYRGEIGVLLINLGRETATIAHGERIAQLVIAPVVRACLGTGILDETERGTGGFGSTGTR